MSDWVTFLVAATGKGLFLCLKITCIVAPILFAYEVAKAYGIFQRPWPVISTALIRLGLGPKALIPILAGLFLGILYGGGIMLAMSQEEGLSRRERLTLAVFLSLAHAVVEDTVIFVVLGASAVGVLGPRLALAVMLCLWLARRPYAPETSS